VFPVRYGPNLYILFRRNSVVKGLNLIAVYLYNLIDGVSYTQAS
jgi:hypothetical protein